MGPLTQSAPPQSEVWLDGGHNEAGGRVLGEAMADMEDHSPRPLVLVCGTLTTKDTAGFLRAFRGLAQSVIAVPILGEHTGRSAAEVAAIARAEGFPANTAAGLDEALEQIAGSFAQSTTPPRILIAGSLYLAGEALARNGEVPT